MVPPVLSEDVVDESGPFAPGAPFGNVTEIGEITFEVGENCSPGEATGEAMFDAGLCENKRE